VTSEITAMVKERISAELSGDMDIITTAAENETSIYEKSDWIGFRGEKYHPLLIAHQTREGFAITGMAVLLVDPTRRFVFPSETVAAISKSLLEMGDVQVVLSNA
jgi:hypothetical protein